MLSYIVKRVLMMIPAIVFVILTQRNLVRGLTFGAIKG